MVRRIPQPNAPRGWISLGLVAATWTATLAATLAATFSAAGCGSTSAPAPIAVAPAPRENSPASPAVATAATLELTPVANAAAKASASDWSRFRGPTGMGLAGRQDVPTTWSADENIAWKAPLPGPGASSPIVFGEHIYLTCFTGYIPGQKGELEDLKRHLLKLRRDTGELVWDKSVQAKLPEEPKIRDHGYAANTPAADDAGVVVFFGKSGVFAFDHDGRQKWQTDVGDGKHQWGTSASPVFYQDLVFINASVESESLIALDRKTGKERWRAQGIREAWNTPVVVKSSSGKDELIVTMHGKVLAFTPDKGEPLWSCKTDIGWYMVPSVVAEQGIVYSLGGRSGIAALAVKTGGSGDVTASHRLWTSTKGSNVSSPVYHDGYLYWMHEQRGVAYCAKAETGEVVYEERVPRAGQVYASAILAGGRVYYLTREGKTIVVPAAPKYELLATNDLSDRSEFNGSPAVDGDRLLIRSDKFLYCIGK